MQAIHKAIFGSALLCGLMTLDITAAHAQSAGQPPAFVALTPEQLVWIDFPGRPGAKLAVIEGDLKKAGPFTVRMRFPANYKLAAHWHPGIEHATVISGTLYLGTGDGSDLSKAVALPPGSIAVIQPKTLHFGYTKEEVVIQAHGFGPWETHAPAELPK